MSTRRILFLAVSSVFLLLSLPLHPSAQTPPACAPSCDDCVLWANRAYHTCQSSLTIHRKDCDSLKQNLLAACQRYCGTRNCPPPKECVLAFPTNPYTPVRPRCCVACQHHCVNLHADRANCGVCGHACADKQICLNGLCTDCATGLSRCHNSCVDTAHDNANCGTCDHHCYGAQACCGGTCVDMGTDPHNCGECGNTCASGKICCSGRCIDACTGGKVCCNGACVDQMTDNNNCGACGHQCTGGKRCCNGSCTDTQTDNSNCGSCGTLCETGTALKFCCLGTCRTSDDLHCRSCSTNCAVQNRICCDKYGVPALGCVLVDRNNCGTCGKVCDAD